MELHDFAERILFADTLEEKLAAPEGGIVDERRGKAIALPGEPGRPEALRFSRDDERPSLPGIHQLEDEEQRTVLLHFFANHELLATELMALVLLRFPEAPAEFRRGVYETLREEQKHTRWYVNRMKRCNVEFGRYAVSDFFWKAVAPMETPLDYVTRLSLTFEQANLDYSKYYAGVFRRSGDEASGSILEHIYRDEIGHVNYGLEWFRRWKEAGETDWKAFERRLIFPLSASRAKANGEAPFNAEGRLEAGLTEEFVRELQVFERSKGRTPRVFWFCPDAEAAMAHGLDASGYERKTNVDKLADDLDILPAFLASRDDVVLVRRLPSLKHRENLREWGFPLPEFEKLDEDESLAARSLTKERKLAELRPWAWCPQSADLMEPLTENLTREAEVEAFWNEGIRDLFSKTADAPFSGATVVNSIDETREAIEKIRNAGHEKVVLKAPFGASAQRNQLWKGDESWAKRVLANQGALVLEPWLERVFDFSMQYEMEPGGLRPLGFVRLTNDARGQFQAVQCGPKTCQDMDEELARFLNREGLGFNDESFEGSLASHLETAGYQGPVGVDALVYRDSNGSLSLKPVVEINPRYTFGRVVLELQRRVAPGYCVRLALCKKEDFSPEKPVLKGTPPKLAGGVLALNDPDDAHRVVAVMKVAKRHGDLG